MVPCTHVFVRSLLLLLFLAGCQSTHSFTFDDGYTYIPEQPDYDACFADPDGGCPWP